MGIYKDVVNIVNRNVFLTNLLLLPAIYYCIMGIIHIHNWKIESSTSLYVYLSSWYFMALLLIFVSFFSILYHGTMFSETKPKLQKLGKVDYLFTAPLLGVILIALSIIYFVFLDIKCAGTGYHVNVFAVATGYTIVGLIVFLLKKYFTRGYSRRDFIKKIKYLLSHTFFHYIAYTGITLLILTFFLDNRDIYNTFFIKSC